jgi:hypothetical protein
MIHPARVVCEMAGHVPLFFRHPVLASPGPRVRLHAVQIKHVPFFRLGGASPGPRVRLRRRVRLHLQSGVNAGGRCQVGTYLYFPGSAASYAPAPASGVNAGRWCR